jgi:hypothetical protein
MYLTMHAFMDSETYKVFQLDKLRGELSKPLVLLQNLCLRILIEYITKIFVECHRNNKNGIMQGRRDVGMA